MAVRLRRPNEQSLRELLERCRADALTYEPVGGSLDGLVPPGLVAARWSIDLPGPDSFARGVDALRAWKVHRGAGLIVVADGPIESGSNVAFSAPLPIGSVDAVCRVVATVDEPDRWGFAYGTLSVHPERGEESFLLIRTGTGCSFEVKAVSAPAHPLARLVPGTARRLQSAAVGRYLAAMQRCVEAD